MHHRPSASQAKWEERLEDPDFVNLIPTWESMASFLKQRCRTLETMDFAMANYAPGNQVGSNRIPNARRSAFVASNANPWICIFCNDAGHSISYCQNFKILSCANKLQEAKRLSLGISCLKVGHQVRQCNSSSCRACGSKHHTCLTWETHLPFLHKKEHSFKKHFPLPHPLHCHPLRMLLLHRSLVLILCS